MRKEREPVKGVWAAGTESCLAVLGAGENMCLTVAVPTSRMCPLAQRAWSRP